MKSKFVTITAAAMLCCFAVGCAGNTDSSMIIVDESSGDSETVTGGSKENNVKESSEETPPDSVIQSEETVQPLPSGTEPTASEPQTSFEDVPAVIPISESIESYAVIGEETFENNTDTGNYYAQMTAAFGNNYLGLPNPDKRYIFEYTGKSADIEGSLCREVACYDEHEGERYYMCSYFINHDGTAVYRYYANEERYALLPESEGYGRLDPTLQSADDIFQKTENLYAAVKYSMIPSYYDNCIMIDDIMYYMVCDEALDTKAELLNALDGYFSRDLANILLDASPLKEGENGMLYALDFASPVPENYISARYELTSLTEDSAVFTVFPSFSDENGNIKEMQYDCTALKINGFWRFQTFSLPWEFQQP